MSTFHVVGRGIVGRRVERLLHEHAVVIHDPRHVDIARVRAGDVVVLAHAGEHAHPASAALTAGAHVVSVADGPADTRAQLGLGPLARDHGVSLVIGAAVAPGLACLIARHLASGIDVVDEVHVALHGTAGPACARAHHGSLGQAAVGWHDGSWVEYIGGSGRELCWFPEPIGARDCYRAAQSTPLLVQRAFPGVQRVSMRRTATRRDRLTARLPMLRRPHAEGGVGALRVEVRGGLASGERVTRVAGVAEQIGTAAAATAAAFADLVPTGAIPSGLVVPGSEDVPTLQLLHAIAGYGIRLQTFTGIPQAAS